MKITEHQTGVCTNTHTHTHTQRKINIYLKKTNKNKRRCRLLLLLRPLNLVIAYLPRQSATHKVQLCLTCCLERFAIRQHSQVLKSARGQPKLLPDLSLTLLPIASVVQETQTTFVTVGSSGFSSYSDNRKRELVYPTRTKVIDHACDIKSTTTTANSKQINK